MSYHNFESETEFFKKNFACYSFKLQNDEENVIHDDLNDAAINEVENKGKEHPIENNKELDYKTKIIYSLPSFGKMSSLVMLNIHAMLLYESIGAKIIYMSFFTSLARAIEIILKPTIAHISDDLRSKYGRRKPFIFFGSFLYITFLLLIFNPPFLTSTPEYLSLWFGFFYVLFFIADTIVNVPYVALGPELSKNPSEREELYAWFYFFQYIGVLVTAISPVLLVNYLGGECDCSACYDSSLITNLEQCIDKCDLFCSMQKNIYSLKILSYIICTEFFISVVLLVIFIEEPISKELNKLDLIEKELESETEKNKNKSPQSVNLDKSNELSTISITMKKEMSATPLIPKLYQLLNNKPFGLLFWPWIIDLTVVTTFSTMLPFYLNVVINPQKYCLVNGIPLNSLSCNPQIWLGICISAFFINCMICLVLWHWLVLKIGKKACWKLYSIISVFTFASFSFAGFGTMERGVIFSLLCSIPAGGGYLNDVFMTDIIDYDEFLSGKRNEGLYTVFISFVPKFVSVFSQSLPISILGFLGYKASEDGIVADQSDQVIYFIKFVNFFISSFSYGFHLL